MSALIVQQPTTVAQVQRAISAAGLSAEIATTPGRADVAVTPVEGDQVEAVRAALDMLVQPHVPLTDGEAETEYATILDDLDRGIWLVLTLALLQAATATAVVTEANY